MTREQILKSLLQVEGASGLQRVGYWQIDGKVPAWDKGHLCGVPPTECVCYRAERLADDRGNPLPGIWTFYGAPDSPLITLTITDNNAVYAYDAVPGQLMPGTVSAFERLRTVLTNRFGATNVTLCENGTCSSGDRHL